MQESGSRGVGARHPGTAEFESTGVNNNYGTVHPYRVYISGKLHRCEIISEAQLNA